MSNRTTSSKSGPDPKSAPLSECRPERIQQIVVNLYSEQWTKGAGTTDTHGGRIPSRPMGASSPNHSPPPRFGLLARRVLQPDQVIIRQHRVHTGFIGFLLIYL